MQASRARLFKEYKEVQREKAVDPVFNLFVMIPTSLSGLPLSRDQQRLLMRAESSNLPFLFQSSILCNLLKCGS